MRSQNSYIFWLVLQMECKKSSKSGSFLVCSTSHLHTSFEHLKAERKGAADFMNALYGLVWVCIKNKAFLKLEKKQNTDLCCNMGRKLKCMRNGDNSCFIQMSV